MRVRVSCDPFNTNFAIVETNEIINYTRRIKEIISKECAQTSFEELFDDEIFMLKN